MDDLERIDDRYLYEVEGEELLIREPAESYRTGGTSDFTDLRVWPDAMDPVARIYRLTTSFPNGEQFGLTSQMRRCAVSVPSTIAEGQARGSGKDFARFLNVARGSLAELQTQILLAQRLGYLSESEARPAVEPTLRVKKQAAALKHSILNNLN